MVRNSRICPGLSGSLSSRPMMIMSSDSWTSMMRASRTRLTSDAQQKPEGRLVERDAVLVVEVEVLDRQVAAVGDDDLPRGARIVEAEASGAFHVELALHALVVGAGLNEAAFQSAEIFEVAADLVDQLRLLRIERDAAVRVGRGDLGVPGRSCGCGRRLPDRAVQRPVASVHCSASATGASMRPRHDTAPECQSSHVVHQAPRAFPNRFPGAYR